MSYLGRKGAVAPLTSADIPVGIVEGTDIAFLENASGTQNLGGTYSTERMYLNDSYTLTGDVTITGHLALGTIADSDVVITQDSTERTITGSGTLESGDLLHRGEDSTDLTGMTGTIGSGATFPSGHVLNVGFGSWIEPYAVTNSWANVKGLSVTLTPKSTSSKFLIIVDLKMGGDTNSEQASRIAYEIPAQSVSTTATGYEGKDPHSNRTAVMSATFDDNPHTDAVYQVGGTYLHSPTLTGLNPITYTAQARNLSNGTSYVNRTHTNASGTEGFTTASSITVMEIAG